MLPPPCHKREVGVVEEDLRDWSEGTEQLDQLCRSLPVILVCAPVWLPVEPVIGVVVGFRWRTRQHEETTLVLGGAERDVFLIGHEWSPSCTRLIVREVAPSSRVASHAAPDPLLQLQARER